jgi:hypothetical protein
MFNETLLRQGYAQLWVIDPNDRYEARFDQAQQEAKNAGRGIWGLTKQQQCELANHGNGIGEGSPRCARDDEEPSASDGGADDGQYADGKDDVIPGTVRKGALPGTGGPPLVLLPWAFALCVAGVALLRRS